jgi:hypothetical protein
MQEVLGYPPLSMLVQGESNDSHLTPGMQAKAAVWGRGRLVLTRHQLVIYAAGRQALLNQTLGTSVMDFAPSHFL